VYPPEHILSGDELTHEIDLTLITPLMKCLTPQNSLVFIRNKNFADVAVLQEEWYGTKYNVNAYSATQLSQWTHAMDDTENFTFLHLPDPNPFVPTDFELRVDESVVETAPQLIEVVSTLHSVTDNTQSISATPGKGLLSWHKLDRIWKMPKV
jgi:secreted Zn-dependent insulinase-like peptidase